MRDYKNLSDIHFSFFRLFKRVILNETKYSEESRKKFNNVFFVSLGMTEILFRSILNISKNKKWILSFAQYDRYLYFITSLLLASILLLISCGKNKTNDETNVNMTVDVVTGKPLQEKMVEYLDLNANTVYLKQEIVRATFHGFIEKSYKNIGDAVSRGDVLFLLKTKESDATDSIIFKMGNMNFTGLIKQTARTSGILTELNFQTGDFIAEGEQLAVIVDPQSLKIMLNVPYQNAGNVHLNSNYSVRLPDGRNLEAKVIRRIPSVDASNQTESFILELLSHTYIPANLNVIIKVPLKSVNDAMALPKTAVMANETQTEFWVMKLMNDSTAVRLNIRKGIETDSLVQIAEPPLNLNDRFIVDGAFGLPDTAKIREHR